MNPRKSILLLTRYGRNGPSSRVRHYQYLPALKNAGFDVTVSPFFDEDYIRLLYSGGSRRRIFIKSLIKRLVQLCSFKRYDLIWIEKETLPWCPNFLERSFSFGRRYVADFDDLWNIRYDEHHSAFLRWVLRGKLEAVAANATGIVAGNLFIADWASYAGAQNIAHIPSVVDVDHYPGLDPPDGPFTVGWIGTPITEKYLLEVAEPLRRLQQNSGGRFIAIGVSEQFELPGVKVERVPWSEETESARLSECHVGIMPLPDEPWERGKCGYKLIQFMAAGRPVVASPVGANPAIVRDGETGYLAGGLDEWTDRLTQLAADRERARTMGLAARERVEQHYSTEVAASKLIAFLENCINKDRAASRARSS